MRSVQKRATQIDQIRDWLNQDPNKPVELDAAAQYRLERLIKADEFLTIAKREGGRFENVAKSIQNYFQVNDPTYSQATAYRDIKDAKKLFGTLHDAGRWEYNLDMVWEMLQQTREDARKLGADGMASRNRAEKEMREMVQHMQGRLEKEGGTGNQLPPIQLIIRPNELSYKPQPEVIAEIKSMGGDVKRWIEE